jgi:phosphoribosyl-AMP cyclohydrolase / phosphoribosyl-ATP pyrophosphohydrolase
MKSIDADTLDWDKSQGLLPAIVQHHLNGSVLMLGYMDRAALEQTLQTGKVTFFSRSRNRLWTKGETSGNWLTLRSIDADCDNDTLLLRAEPAGPTCHRGTASCFGDDMVPKAGFLAELDALVAARESERPQGSYTTQLFASGVRQIAQKVGEEGVETALAAVVQDDAALLGESADLFFHLLVLLRARGLGLADLSATLAQRHAIKETK